MTIKIMLDIRGNGLIDLAPGNAKITVRFELADGTVVDAKAAANLSETGSGKVIKWQKK